jgi:pimeloyl-ACP methyl ester carboxylesterase
MMKNIRFKSRKIFFHDKGEGSVIVLLHGFTESSGMWKEFSRELSKKYRVICIDLPGHGKSETLDGCHDMDLQAEVVRAVLKKRKIGKCLMVGHSMGGYVTLAFAAKYPEMLCGFSLFHAHCFADSREEQENRARTIRIVNDDKFAFISQFIPQLFPLEVHKKFSRQIDKLIREASGMSKEAVIAALEGLKARPDRVETLLTTTLPVLFILGLKDSKAPLDRLWEMITMPAHSESLILRNCGHMGYIEAPDETLAAIKGFARKVF